MDWQKLALEQAALIRHLQARIAELEARIAVLEKNSANSSKPPSSDIVKPPKIHQQVELVEKPFVVTECRRNGQ